MKVFKRLGVQKTAFSLTDADTTTGIRVATPERVFKWTIGVATFDDGWTKTTPRDVRQSEVVLQCAPALSRIRAAAILAGSSRSRRGNSLLEPI
jgi:hypothetical protein